MSGETAQATERTAQGTRQRILGAAFNEIYRHGFQGMRLDDVLSTTGLTKGALYYHFPNKLALGYAVVDEVIEEMVLSLWIRPLQTSDNPLDTLIDSIVRLDEIAGENLMTLGCPLNNLAQEMSPLDEGFRQRLDRVFQIWHRGFVEAFEQARAKGQLGSHVDVNQTATIVMAALEGCIGLTKSSRQLDRLRECTAALAGYLKTLRTELPAAGLNDGY